LRSDEETGGRVIVVAISEVTGTIPRVFPYLAEVLG
jgi:hypothetical protein